MANGGRRRHDQVIVRGDVGQGDVAGRRGQESHVMLFVPTRIDGSNQSCLEGATSAEPD